MMNSTELANAADRMLQGTRHHHVQLSTMADTKANMLLTIASLVITLSVKYVVDPTFRWPAILLIAFCLATIVLATYAAMPKIPILRNGRVDPHAPNFNPLFFGDFSRMSYDEYRREMQDVLNDGQRIYETMLKEIYQLGSFLAAQKYRYIRMAYLSFIFGFIFSGGLLIGILLRV